MSGTSYVMNKTILSDYDDLKRLQVQRDRLEKATLDYKSKGYAVETLTIENKKLKQELSDESREKSRLDSIVRKQLTGNVEEIALLKNEIEFTQVELEKYKIYSTEIEKNNDNWRLECGKQTDELEDLAFEAETLNNQINELENHLHSKREELNEAKLERQEFLKLKASLNRQKHNQQILETDYQTFKKQNQELKESIIGIEEKRIRSQLELEKFDAESQKNQNEIQREVRSLTDDFEAQKTISTSQRSFLDELKSEVDQLRKQNMYLKNKLDLLD